MNKILELAKKIKALADQGVGGEKLNAQKMLAALCAKHGIDIDELEERETVATHTFIATKLTEKLLDQIIWKVCGGKTKLYEPGRKRYGTRIECTEAQRLEILALYSIYSRALAKAVEDVKRAFIQANDIFPTGDDEDDDEEEDTRTPEQRAEDKRIALLSMGLERTPVFKGLGTGSKR